MKIRVVHTVDQDPVREGIHGPNIWGPVCMAQAPGERKQPANYLLELPPERERSKCAGEYSSDTNPEHDAMEELDLKIRE